MFDATPIQLGVFYGLRVNKFSKQGLIHSALGLRVELDIVGWFKNSDDYS